jgi:N6-L-threonylcarbamoyladenine synthase
MALILGIESSCDDMAAAVVRGGTEVLASVVEAQDRVHAPYGGVVPELASRDHVKHVRGVVAAALERSGVRLEQLDGIGVTAGPGLIGSLLVGLCFAKALAYRARKPLLAVHHIEGHLASARIGSAAPLGFPFLGIVISGGHTAFYRVGHLADIQLLGQTRDDAAGEAFDKVAKRMGLPYPGGREIDRCARSGRADAYALPRPMLDEGLEMSFSGLKTATALEIARAEQRGGGALSAQDLADLSASFQEAVADVLVAKTRRALRRTALGRAALVGGLAANSRIRARMDQLAAELAVELRYPPIQLCTDNAAMVAAVADQMLAEGRLAGLELEAFSRVPLRGLAP